MDIAVVLEILVVAGAIIMGVRMGGLGLGLWGVAGVFVLVFIFELPPGSPPINAMLIILAVITAAAAMQAAGGIDFLVRIATKIRKIHPALPQPLRFSRLKMSANTRMNIMMTAKNR